MPLRLKEDPREWRKATLLTVLALAVLSSVLCWRRVVPRPAWVPVLVGLGFIALAAWIQPHWFRGFYRVSTRFGFHLSQVLARVVLAGIFLFFITPVALVLRLLGKDPLRLKRTANAESYWSDTNRISRLDRMF